MVRNSQATKHFYIESQRVVTKFVEANEGLLQEYAETDATANTVSNTTSKTDTSDATVNYDEKKGKMLGLLKKNY